MLLRISRLIPDNILKLYKDKGELASLEGRCTGKSYGRIMGVIGEALQNPERSIPYTHSKFFGERDCDYRLLIKIIDTLGLEFIHVRKMDGTIKYCPYRSHSL